uniref:Uncharacterized protein n=1 Tax=Oryza glumipatula TaxID=40148 RepID=A0A0D9Y313_9ORYZ
MCLKHISRGAVPEDRGTLSSPARGPMCPQHSSRGSCWGIGGRDVLRAGKRIDEREGSGRLICRRAIHFSRRATARLQPALAIKNAVCGARTPQPIPQCSLRFPLDTYAARDLCLLGARSISASLQRAISGCSQATGVGGQVQRRAPRPGSGGHGDVVLVEQQVHACQAALPGALELGATAWHPASLT